MTEKKQIDIPFEDVYPMKKDSINTILDNLNCDNSDSMYLSPDITLYSTPNIVIVNKRNASKTPTVLNILEMLHSENITKSKIVLSEYSINCHKATTKYNKKNGTKFDLIKIEKLMTEDMKETIPVMMGRSAQKSIGDSSIPKKSVTIRVPITGYKEFPTNNVDVNYVYRLLENKIDNNSSNDNSFESIGFDLVMTAFEEVAEVLSSGKNITANKWNKILDKHGVFKHLEGDEE